MPRGTIGNIRLLSKENQIEDQRVTFSGFTGSVNKQMSRKAYNHFHHVKETQINKWLDKWIYSIPHDIDPGYYSLFPKARSHIAVPCYHNGILYGLISVDHLKPKQFKTLLIKWLCIIGAHTGPLVLNASLRERLSKERKYLSDVIDAIPDEIMIVNDKAHILMMNKAKKERCPGVREGMLCYTTLETGKARRCSGCYTFQTMENDTPILQGIWRSIRKGEQDFSYGEISTGKIDTLPSERCQAVEVYRDVTLREKILSWISISEIQSLWTSHDSSPEDVWDRVASGLISFGFEEFQICTFCQDKFKGVICTSSSSYKGKKFTTIELTKKMIYLRRFY